MKQLILAAAMAASFAGAHAATVSYSAAKALTTTNWTDTLSLSQFNSALGTLTGVSFAYNGGVSSIFKLESLDAAPATVTVTSAGSIVFSGPFSDTLAISANSTRNLSAFDGSIDFGGTSGAIVGPVAGTRSGSFAVGAGGLAGYIGAGNFSVGIAGNGNSSANGAGNLIAQINTTASADVTVTYTYTAVPTPPAGVPEPTSLALVGLALAGAGAASRRRGCSPCRQAGHRQDKSPA